MRGDEMDGIREGKGRKGGVEFREKKKIK